MELRWFDGTDVGVRPLEDVGKLLARDDGFFWLDIPVWSLEAEQVLGEVMGIHPLALDRCRERNHIPMVHVYPRWAFLAVHAPELGSHGHVHYLELDQFIGENFLVTVHGPINPKVPMESALRETQEVIDRIENGRLRPTSSFGLTYAIVSAIARRESMLTNDLAREVGLVEQRVTGLGDEEPQNFLDELFTIRHELLTIKTMAAQGSQIYRRAIKLTTFAPPEGLDLMRDLLDQYERVASISQAQLDFLMGVTEFYRARTDTKMTIAAERLAVIAAITLPVTSVSSVMGMNVIVNESTHWVLLILLLLLMLGISGAMLRWTKKQGWW